ncbi:transcription factor SCREAM2-like [Phragmites australis]|uniref:transcription factor SCREAM2-like n=1 Tax=Phragmites australis TaxID=29695 RepID=UPI002D7925F0|nr:transcription factor SCREAM2-like [Phragmites australis]
MMSRERKKAGGLHEKLQILRSITQSHALSDTSIIMDASEYIKELTQKIVRLNQEMACEQQDAPKQQNSFPTDVTVETLGHGGFLVNVFSDKSCPGLLVSVLEAFDELGLNVLEATASCADTFRLEAAGGENQAGNVDEHVVKQAVLQAVRNSSEGGSEREE